MQGYYNGIILTETNKKNYPPSYNGVKRDLKWKKLLNHVIFTMCEPQ